MILAGDIGGTKCILAVYSFSGKKPEPILEKSFPSDEFSGLEEVVSTFKDEAEQVLAPGRKMIQAACFGIAGPIVDQKVNTTNLPWAISGENLQEVLETKEVLLINDLEATGHGILNLEKSRFKILNRGNPDPSGQAALIAAGTGLGEGFFARWNGKLHPLPSEGGHSSFAPCSKIEIELLEFLSTKYDHVSTERVLSGPGLYNIYSFLRDSGLEREPKTLASELRNAEDPSPLISAKALEGFPSIAVRTLELFTAIYGSAAANLALKVKSTSGVFIGGGIAPKIMPFLTRKIFMDAFLSKGRMRGLLEQMPVKISLEPKTALLGAACRGVETLTGEPSEL